MQVFDRRKLGHSKILEANTKHADELRRCRRSIVHVAQLQGLNGAWDLL
jgi:hypothetical protein